MQTIQTVQTTQDDLHVAVTERRATLVELRRHFHQHPELSTIERETAATIADHLQKLGLEVTEGVADTGVVAVLRGTASAPDASLSTERAILIRADIDALPVDEANDVAYRSQAPGVMHACGHDGHIAMALVVAEVLAERRGQFRGTVKFAFQPAEERVGGASRMIAAGVLRDPPVGAVLGIHLWSGIHVGDVVAQPGPIFAAGGGVTLRVRGRGGHGAVPHLNIDPVIAAANILVALQTLVSREISPFHPAVVTFGSVHGGTAGNVVPDEIELRGTFRTFDTDEHAFLARRIREVAQGVAQSLRAEADVEIMGGGLPCVNDATITALVRQAAEATVGAEHVPTDDRRQSVSDDMGVFLAAVPGCYILVGAGNPEQGIDAPHHSSHFDIDEEALPIGAEVMVRSALNYLAQS